MSSTAAVGGQWANIYFKRTVDTTAEGIRRLTGTSLAVSFSIALYHAAPNVMPSRVVKASMLLDRCPHA